MINSIYRHASARLRRCFYRRAKIRRIRATAIFFIMKNVPHACESSIFYRKKYAAPVRHCFCGCGKYAAPVQHCFCVAESAPHPCNTVFAASVKCAASVRDIFNKVQEAGRSPTSDWQEPLAGAPQSGGRMNGYKNRRAWECTSEYRNEPTNSSTPIARPYR
jgi:hypothetical protein